MQAVTCELCGSNEIIKKDGLYVCQHCGTKYSVEEARKLISVVRIDKTNETENLLMIARRARDENNKGNAARYYDMVLRNDPTNWEASFYQVYFQAMSCNIIQIRSAACSVANNLRSTIRLICDYVHPEEQEKVLNEVIERVVHISTMMVNAATNHYNKFSSSDGALEEYNERVVAVGNIYEKLEASAKEFFSGKVEILLHIQKIFNSYVSARGGSYNDEYRTKTTARLAAEIKQKDRTYSPPAVSTGGCYVATCAYGSYDCPQVWVLRRYRDEFLSLSWYGRAFVRTYYAISPTLVRLFGKNTLLRSVCRKLLDVLVGKLLEAGVSDKPYKDK